MKRAIGRRLPTGTALLGGGSRAPCDRHAPLPPCQANWAPGGGGGGRGYAEGGSELGTSSSPSPPQRVGDPFRERRGLIDTAEELLKHRPELKPKGWDWHAWQLFVALLPGTCVLVWGHYASKKFTDDFIEIQTQKKEEVAKDKQRQEEHIKQVAEASNERLLSRIDALEKQLEELRRQQQPSRDGGNRGSSRSWLTWITGGTQGDGDGKDGGDHAPPIRHKDDAEGGETMQQPPAAELTTGVRDSKMSGIVAMRDEAASAGWWPTGLLWRGGGAESSERSGSGSESKKDDTHRVP